MSIARTNSLSQSSSGIPLLVTRITSGTGTFTPQAATTWCKVTLVGAGGSGATGGAAYLEFGGSGGAVTSYWVPRSSSYTYAVGAGGVAGVSGTASSGSAGGSTTFSSLTSVGGTGGNVSYINQSWKYSLAGTSGAYGVGGTVNQSGSGYGAGGGGGASSGGAGSSGLLIIEEY
jgi:hypothetical protein